MSIVLEIDLGSGGGGGAPTDNTYILKDGSGTPGLTAAIELSLLGGPGLLGILADGSPYVDTTLYIQGTPLNPTSVTFSQSPNNLATDPAFTYTTGLQVLAVPTIHTNTVQAPAGDLGLSAIGVGAQVNISATAKVFLNSPAYELNGLGSGFVKATTGVLSIDTNTYLTTGSASATYLTIANAATTYQPILSLTSTEILYATGAHTVGQNTGFTFTAATHVLTIGTTTVGEDGSILIRSGTNGQSIGSSTTAAINITDPNAAGAANVAVDDNFYGQALIGYSNGNSADLGIGTQTGQVLRLRYLMNRASGSGTDAMTIDGTTGAITAVTAFAASVSVTTPTVIPSSGALNIGGGGTIQSNGGGSVLTLQNAVGASTVISLSASAIDVTGLFRPVATNTHDLGSSSRVWNNGWIKTFNLSTITPISGNIAWTDNTGVGSTPIGVITNGPPGVSAQPAAYLYVNVPGTGRCVIAAYTA